MKRQYWLIIVFVVWCLVSAWWYMFGVKGIKTDPQFFSPQATLISIIEVLTMLLIGCLLGYAIAWSVRGDAIEEQDEMTEKLESNNSSLTQSNTDLKTQLEMWRNKHQQELGVSRHRINEISLERDQLQQQLSTTSQQLEKLESAISSKQDDSLNSHSQLEQLETEAGTLRYRVRQLEFQNKEHEALNVKLKSEIETLQTARREKLSSSDHPFVRPVEPDEKDDLTSIKGIGPFIEKRLNMLGIYTFKQLSELTPELIDRVGNAIEFFPGRIERENWIGQAQEFSRRS